MKRVVFGLVALALAVALFAGVAEGVVRYLRPPPRVQIIDPSSDKIVLSVHDGVPLWHFYQEPGLVRDGGCDADDSVDVAIVSDSILWVADVESFDEQRLLHHLRNDLTDLGACVVDVSAAGYVPYQQFEAMKLAQAERGIDLALFVVWKPSGRYRLVGTRWWGLGTDQMNDAGLPLAPVPMPAFAHAWLLEHSAAWRYVTSAVLPPSLEGVGRDAVDYLAAIDWARENGVRLIFVEATSLSKPLSVTAREDAKAAGYGWVVGVREAAAAAGFPYVRLAEVLADQDVEAIRHDLCCHYNGAGHAAMAEHFVPMVHAEVEALIAARDAVDPPPEDAP